MLVIFRVSLVFLRFRLEIARRCCRRRRHRRSSVSRSGGGRVRARNIKCKLLLRVLVKNYDAKSVFLPPPSIPPSLLLSSTIIVIVITDTRINFYRRLNAENAFGTIFFSSNTNNRRETFCTNARADGRAKTGTKKPRCVGNHGVDNVCCLTLIYIYVYR